MREKIKKHKKLCIILAIVLLLAILLASCVSQIKKTGEKMMAVMNQTQTAQVERRTLISSISATGAVDSPESKEISVNLTGVEIKNISVEVGDIVEKGSLLCEFDSEDIEENLANAKATLAAASTKTQMDISSAQRSLAEAEATRNIELERADADLADAWNDYLKAQTDQAEAEEEWNKSKEDTIGKKAEYEYRKEQLTAAGSGGGGEAKQYEIGFNDARAALISYAQTNNVVLGSGAADSIGLGNDLSKVTVGDGGAYHFQTADPSIQKELTDRLKALTQLQTNYKNSLAAESSYAALQQEVSSWQAKYNTAKQAESSAEAAYEQAVSAAEAKLDTYNSKVRAKEDTQRNQDSSIQTKTDSLTTSKLNATTSTLSDEQKVEEYQKQLDNCTLKAPISGVITAIKADVGDTYTGGTLFIIEDVSSYEISAEIDEYDIGKVEEGQTVVIKTNGTGDDKLAGTVQKIAPRATEQAGGASSSEVTYNVRISIDTKNDLLKLDMTAKLSIILDSKENILTVPYEAIREDEEGKYYVEVVDSADNASSQAAVDANGGQQVTKEGEGNQQPGQDRKEKNANIPEISTRRVYVEKGIESDYYIEVISDEITEGMEVVVPRTQNEGLDFQMMMQNQGPMGGF